MSHTLNELRSLPDAGLNALAATVVMGWTLCRERWVVSRKGELPQFTGYSTADSSSLDDVIWMPAIDRNQSGGLLARCVEKGASFGIAINDSNRYIDFLACDDLEWINVPGNSARAETIAAILAAEAMENRSE